MARSRSYWPILREIRARYDLDLPEARAFWRELRDDIQDRHGRRPFRTDLDRHPRVSQRLVRDVKMATAVRVEKAVGPLEKLPAQVMEPLAEVLRSEPRAEELMELEEYELTATTKGHTPRER